MYIKVHSKFILTPLLNVLRDGVIACNSISDGIESFPMGEYYLQSLFLRMTGAQEQKMKCICWELATNNYHYRYNYLKNSYGECSNYDQKNNVYKDMVSCILEIDPNFQPKSIIEDIQISNKTISLKRKLPLSVLDVTKEILSSSHLIYWDEEAYQFFTAYGDELINERAIDLSNKNFLSNRFQKYYKIIIWNHRNRCAHNLMSYQQDLPSLDALTDKNRSYCNYFFRYAILILIDEIFLLLYKKYISLIDPYNFGD
jgi:hypothetical protein